MPTPIELVAQAMMAPATANPNLLRQGERRKPMGFDFGFGQREDGTNKGMGYLGALPTADGRNMTEFSIEDTINGKNTLMPSIVPTLSRMEIAHLLGGGDVNDDIARKAMDFARRRVEAGQPTFARAGEQQFIGNLK